LHSQCLHPAPFDSSNFHPCFLSVAAPWTHPFRYLTSSQASCRRCLASSGRPARAGTTAAPALSPSGSRTCCNTLRQPLQHVAARNPAAGPPAARCCAPLGPPPACSYSARAASLPAGPAPSGPGRVARQPAPAPASPPHGSDLSRSFGNEFTPQEANRWSGASSLLIVPRVCVCAGRITNEPAQTPRLPVGPPCRAAWARNPRGAESRLIAHALNEAHLVYSASSAASPQLGSARRTK